MNSAYSGQVNLAANGNGDLFGLMSSGGVNGFGAVVEFPNTGGGPVTGELQRRRPPAQTRTLTLLVDASGNLFGTTLSGGANNAGTVFELQKMAGGYAAAPTILTSFGSGIVPWGRGHGNLVEDAAGDLFGVTVSSVFEVKKTGAGYSAPANLVPFPVGTVMGNIAIDAKGNIFGTTLKAR